MGFARVLRHPLCVVPAAALFLVACHKILSLEEPDGLLRPIPTPDVGALVDAGLDAGGPADPCEAGPSLPPATGVDDDPATELPTLVFALRSLRFETDAGVAGFNLDRTCTCSGTATPPCVPRAKNTDVVCDADGGIDNALAAITKTSILGPAEVDAFVERGSGAALIAIDGYNGRANDRSVRVSLGRSAGLYSDKGCDGNPRGRPANGALTGKIRERDGGASPNPFTPTWDGCDEWYVRKDEVEANGGTLFPRFTPGYVADGVLVVDGERTAPFFFGETRLDVRQAKLTARIGRVGSSVQLQDVQTAGLVDLGDLIRSLGVLASGAPGVPVCRVPALYQAGVDALCAQADLPLDLGRVGKGDTCSALSLGTRASAVSARVDISDRFIFDETPVCDDSLRDEKACPSSPSR